MKRLIFIIRFLILNFLLLEILFAKLHSQVPEPCTPDCFETPFGEVMADDIDLGNGCIVRVWYTWRHACYTYYDIQIVKIQTLNPACTIFSDRQIFELSFKMVIEIGRMMFPPGLNECNVNWRISIASCWIRWHIITGGQSVLIWLPCYGTGCCYQPFEVCRGADRKITVLRALGDPYPAQNCDGAWSPVPDQTCRPICDWIYFEHYYGLTLPKNGNKNFTDNTNDENYLEIASFENQKVLNIKVRTKSKQKYVIQIIDVYGNVLIEQRGEIESFDEEQIQIKIDGLKSGLYFYNILFNGSIIFNDGLLIAN